MIVAGHLLDLLRKQTGIYKNTVTIKTTPGGIQSIEYIVRKPFNRDIIRDASGNKEIAGIETLYADGKPEALLVRHNLKT